MEQSADHSAIRGVARPWTVVIVLTIIYAYAFVDRVILALLVEPIKTELRLGDLQIGLLLGLAFAAFYALLNLPAGQLVDRTNRRALVGFASIGWAAMTVCCGLAANFDQMFLARAGVGLAEAVIGPAAFSLIRDALPQDSRGGAFSIYAMAPILGGAVALVGGGGLLHLAQSGALNVVGAFHGVSSWRVVLVIVGLCGMPLSLLLLLFPEPFRAAPAKSRSFGAQIMDAVAFGRNNIALLAALVGFVGLGAMMSFGQSAWLPAMLGRRWRLRPDQIGPMLGGLGLVFGLGGLSLSGLLLKHLTAQRRDICLFGALAALGTAVGFAGAALAPSLVMALALVGVGYFFVGVSFPVGATTLAQVTPAPIMGAVTGGYLLAQTLVGQAGGPLLIAYGADHIFHGRMGLSQSFALMMAVFGAAAAACAWTLGAGLKRERFKQDMSAGAD